MKKKFLFLLMAFFLTVYSCNDEKTPAEFVDQFIGTDAHGHTFPGATLPFGMVQLSPDTDIQGWDWCSGYHSSDSSIKGFSHKHLSGTGASDYGDILFMPTTGDLKLNPGPKDQPGLGYRSSFSHDNEKASVGYYNVFLDDYNIDVKLTTTMRTGIHQYTFPKSAQSNVIIDLVSGIQDKPLKAFMKINGNDEIVGYRESTGWANHQRIYFIAKFSKNFEDYGFSINDNEFSIASEVTAKNVVGYVSFPTTENEIVTVKVGISAVDIEGARKNLEAESLSKTFDQVKNEAFDTWNSYLNQVDIDSDDDTKTIFYTALYHSLIAPNTFMDVDNRYRGMDGEIHTAKDFTNYTIFSLWDTFRATHPLFTILYPKKVNNMIRTFQKKYDQSGLLPVWELDANETNCMIGYHSIPVIVDAYIKGIRDYDVEKIYEAMKTSSMQNIRGTDFYREYSYIPAHKENESVSKTLEYAYNDWCIAQMAKLLSKNDDYQTYIKRAQYYLNVFDKETKFMRAKRQGKFAEPFDPKSVSGDYTEANAWQYSFFVPQDVENMIALYGGSDSFEKKLDRMFVEKSKLTGKHQSDITGLIGQYAHGNEPSHHMAYLYNYIGKPWKSQKYLRKIITELYTSERDGICGNEDCGQMSSWYVLSALGFYPVTPGTEDYVIGAPIINSAKINLPSGKTFEIDVKNQSKENIYIQQVFLNGKEHKKSFISHSDIINGGKLSFVMSDSPNKEWASQKQNYPKSSIEEKLTPVPHFIYDNLTFFDEQKIELKNIYNTADIFYSIDNGKYNAYSSAIKINKSTQISAYSKKDDFTISDTTSVNFKKIPFRKDIEILSKYNDRYSAGGDIGLIDYVFGNNNFWTGEWQGYEGRDFEAIVDLMKVRNINYISTKYLQATSGWIFLPKKVEYLVSKDGKSFQSIGRLSHKIPLKKDGTIIKEFCKNVENLNTRFIKVKAEGVKICPDWHPGAGGPAWLFIDEIVVE